MRPKLTDKKRAALNCVKSVRCGLDGIIRMLESDAYCVDVIKQISAIQASLERVDRVLLHDHLEWYVSDAVRKGGGQAAIEELVGAVKFTAAFTVSNARLMGTELAEAGEFASAPRLTTTILTIPGISSQSCKASLEGFVAPIVGVAAVEVDVSAKTITVHHDGRAPARVLVETIEEQGYHVADA